jgi:hypothetical protein
MTTADADANVDLLESEAHKLFARGHELLQRVALLRSVRREGTPCVTNVAATPTPLLTKSELAAHLKKSPASIDRYVRDGLVPYVRVGAERRFDLTAVLSALGTRQATPNSAPSVAAFETEHTGGVRLLSKSVLDRPRERRRPVVDTRAETTPVNGRSDAGRGDG